MRRESSEGSERGTMWIRVLAVFLIFLTPVYSYADPGSGILIYQMLAAAFVGALFYVRRLFNFLKFRARKRD